MGRRRSNYICERCGERGFKQKIPLRVIHYDPTTRKRRTCYLTDFLRRQAGDLPLNEFQGISPLYHKLGEIAHRLDTLAHDVRKIQRSVYQLKPDDKVASRCVTHLNTFEKGFIIPLEKLFDPYVDQRYLKNWTSWFNTQMVHLKHGRHAAGALSPNLTGQYIFKLSKNGKNLKEIPVKSSADPKIDNKKSKAILAMAIDIIKLNQWEKALGYWSKNTGIQVELQSPREFYEKEMNRRRKQKRHVTKKNNNFT
jgi:hypothetical protein